MSETAVERRLREMCADGPGYGVDIDAIDAGREALVTLKKLTNEVTAILALAEHGMRQAAGSTNVAVLKQRHDEARALLARCEGGEKK